LYIKGDVMDEKRNEFLEYLRQIKDVSQDKCAFCGKTPDQIRKEYFEYMKNPTKEFEDIDLDDLIIMTYKLMKPVCAGCYFSIKNNPKLVKEIMDKAEDDVW